MCGHFPRLRIVLLLRRMSDDATIEQTAREMISRDGTAAASRGVAFRDYDPLIQRRRPGS